MKTPAITHHRLSRIALAAALLATAAATAHADAIDDWNLKAGELIVESKLDTPPAVRVMAIVQTAAHEAVGGAIGIAGTSAAKAAVAAAHRATLSKLIPSQQAAVKAAFRGLATCTTSSALRTVACAR